MERFKNEWKSFLAVIAVFIGLYWLPVGIPRFDNALTEALAMVKWYAREHVILCLIPAFFIAGAIGVFISQGAVMRYLGAGAKKIVSYAVASVSGAVLAVCSCTILPLFAGIYSRGAGIGPATAFLYAGPAVNILAIILTARILGVEMGVARALGAITFSIIIGLIMSAVFPDEKKEALNSYASEGNVGDSPWKQVVFFITLIGLLVSATLGKPEGSDSIWLTIFELKWFIVTFFWISLSVILNKTLNIHSAKIIAMNAFVLIAWLFARGNPQIPFIVGVLGISVLTGSDREKGGEWFEATWGFVKQIAPLLLIGVAAAGFFLGNFETGTEGVIPPEWIHRIVGGNGIGATLVASVIGSFMYLATLTEVPILQGLMSNGMGKGPALTLLLAGPALSIQSILILRSIMGVKKTAVYVILVIIMSTIVGYVYGNFI